jgi:hypothetical protein
MRHRSHDPWLCHHLVLHPPPLTLEYESSTRGIRWEGFSTTSGEFSYFFIFYGVSYLENNVYQYGTPLLSFGKSLAMSLKVST